MSDAIHNQDAPRPYHEREYEDPHYHDEDPEIQNDENRRRLPARRKLVRRPPPRRHYEE